MYWSMPIKERMTSKLALTREVGYTFRLIQAKGMLNVDKVKAFMPRQSDDQEDSDATSRPIRKVEGRGC